MNERVYLAGDYDTAGTVTTIYTSDPDGNEMADAVIEVTFDDGIVDMLTWDDVIDASTVDRLGR